MVANSCFWCDDVDRLGRGPLTRPWSPDLDGRWSSHGSWSSTIRLEIFQLKIEQERLRLVSRPKSREEYPNTVGIWILSIWIPNFLRFHFQMVWYSIGLTFNWFDIQMVWYSNGRFMCYDFCTRPTIWIPDQYIRKQDGVHLFDIPTTFDHWNT